MRLSLALLHRYDKQSFGQIIGAAVETSSCGSGENRRLAEGVGSNRWQRILGCKEWCCKEEGQDERGGQSQNLQGDEGPLGEGEEGKRARIQARSGQSESADFKCSIEGTHRPKPESGRKIRGDGQGVGGEAWKELRQHQCLVPHHCQRSKRNQEDCTWQICLGALRLFEIGMRLLVARLASWRTENVLMTQRQKTPSIGGSAKMRLSPQGKFKSICNSRQADNCGFITDFDATDLHRLTNQLQGRFVADRE